MMACSESIPLFPVLLRSQLVEVTREMGGREIVVCNGGHLGPFIIRNERVTNGVSDCCTDPSRLSYEIHYIP